MSYELRVTSYQAERRARRNSTNNSSLVTRNFPLALCAVLLPSLSNCVAPHRAFVPAVDPAGFDDVAFLHYLPTAPTATVGEGVRAVLTLVGPSSNWPTWEQQYAHLRDLAGVKDAWRLAADQTLDHGTLAHMLMAVCRTPRSLNNLLSSATGWGDRRYALQTCVDEGLLRHALAHDPVTGGELLSAVVKASEPPLAVSGGP